MPISTRSVLVGAGIDAAVGLALFAAFSLLRKAKGLSRFYTPRRCVVARTCG